MGKVFALCSGCGGVGKSTVALSLSLYAAKRGKKTILLDASGAARSCDLMLGMESVVVVDLLDVIRQQASLASALYRVPEQENLQFVCASLYEGVSLNELSAVILTLRAMADILVIDLPTGPLKAGPELLDENDALVMLTRPDDISIRALERMMSNTAFISAQRYLVINRAEPSRAKRKLQYSANEVEMLLDIPCSCLLYEDEGFLQGMKKGKLLSSSSLHTRSEFKKLLDQLL